MSGSPFRAPVMWVTGNRWFRRMATGALGRPLASRFVAGETLPEAMVAAEELRGRGIATMLDHLGENVSAPEQAADAAKAYVRALEAIGGAGEGLDAAISIKLSQLGLDFSTELCVAHVERVLEAAAGVGRIVMIDMESHAYVDRTLAVFRDLRDRHDRVGVCVQSYLRRTASDVKELPPASMIRLVKGAYLEPHELVFTERREVDRSFRSLFVALIEAGHRVHVATHDPRLIEGAKQYVQRHGLDPSRVEYQMLFGIRRDLQRRLAAEELPVRVYVPYGAEWYPYLTRRLAERPANMWFFLSNLVRSGR